MSIDVEELTPPQELEDEEKMANGEHGQIGALLSWHLGNVVYPNKLGYLYDAQTSFKWPQLTRSRQPDVAFVQRDRVPDRLRETLPVAPDLAVEIVSPTDYAVEVEEKVAEYLDGGVRLVWVIYPVSRKIMVYRPATRLREQPYLPGDVLTGEDVIPGFQLKIEDLL